MLYIFHMYFMQFLSFFIFSISLLIIVCFTFLNYLQDIFKSLWLLIPLSLYFFFFFVVTDHPILVLVTYGSFCLDDGHCE